MIGVIGGGLVWLAVAAAVAVVIGRGIAIADRIECCPHDEAGAW